MARNLGGAAACGWHDDGDGLIGLSITGLCKRTPITLAGPMLVTCWC
jgi:selenide,water dikinase